MIKGLRGPRGVSSLGWIVRSACLQTRRGAIRDREQRSNVIVHRLLCEVLNDRGPTKKQGFLEDHCQDKDRVHAGQ